MNEIKNELSKLEGCLIKKVIPGSFNSSIIELLIENSDKEEVVLMIKCSWRLSQKNKVLTGWNDPYYSDESNFYVQMKNIVGHAILAAQINELNDIDFLLNEKKLTIFSDLYSSDFDEETENWDFSVPHRNICYSAISNKELQKGTYY